MWKNICIVIFVFSFYAVVVAQTGRNASRCFQFTWLGPRFDNESVFMNATCSDATELAKNVPCIQPLVVSEDGTWPDIEYIWTHHFEETTCIHSQNDVCAKYTYYFNDHPENSTYMCTRAVDTHKKAITNGCFEQISGSYRTRVCFCQSVPGGVPCNGTAATRSSYLVLLLMFSFIVLSTL